MQFRPKEGSSSIVPGSRLPVLDQTTIPAIGVMPSDVAGPRLKARVNFSEAQLSAGSSPTFDVQSQG